VAIEVLRVWNLRVGDVLTATGKTVTRDPQVGAMTPSGKVEVGVDGVRKTWGKWTMVRVERTEARADPHSGNDVKAERCG
jgi:hypothetical protein